MLFLKTHNRDKLDFLSNLKTTRKLSTPKNGRLDKWWQSNLRTFYLSALKSAQRMGPHRKEVIDAIVGNLLGDGYAEKRGNCTRIVLKQSLQKINYIHYLHKIMSDGGVCNENLPKMGVVLAKSGKLYYNVKFATYSFSHFNHIHQSFHVKKDDKTKFSKKVPDNIGELLTLRGLAHWIMDDASLYRHGHRIGGIGISAKSFCFEEMPKLEKALFDNFSIKSTVHKPTMESGKSKPVLYIAKQQIKKVYNLVSPYFEKTQLYKIECT